MATVATNNVLECSICCETFKTPKVLNCGHTFCLDCIQRYIGDRTAKFPCPVCGKIVRIPKGGAKKFTTNYVVHTTTSTSLETHVTGTAASTSLETQVTGTAASTFLETQVTGTAASTSAATQITSNTKQPSSTINHRCPQHSDREVEFYCKTCREGVCSRCMYLHHSGHESVDIESDSTKTNAIEEVSNLEKTIKQKIKDLETTSATLQERSEKLYILCDEECSKVTEYTEMMIADLREKGEKLRCTIKTHFDESQRKLSESKAEHDNHVKNLQVDLETKLPSLVEDSCLTILQALPEMTDLGKFSENLMVTLPDVTYSQWKEPCELKQSNIGTLESRTFYLPKLNDFIFSINDIKDVRVRYDSKNKYTAHGVVWSCLVGRTDDDYLSICIGLLPSDNPTIVSCDIESTFKLLDHSGKDSLEINSKRCFIEKGWVWGRVNFISWTKLTDKQNGFMTEDNQFIVQFDITAIKDIRRKTSE